MSFTLRLLFSGLCIFVPDGRNQTVRVVLVDARAPGTASTGKNHVSHVPSVRFRMDDMVENGGQQPKYYFHPGMTREEPQGMVVLNRDELEIKVNGTSLPNEKVITIYEGMNDFSLVPEMKKVYPEGLDIREECVNGSLDNPNIGVVARMRLKAGTMGAYSGSSFCPQSKNWRDAPYISESEFVFLPAKSSKAEKDAHRQKLATCVFYDTEINSDKVEIYLSGQEKSLLLRPKKDNLVEVMIENAPPLGLEMARPSDSDTDVDFELTYEVAKKVPDEKRVPVRVKAQEELEAPYPEYCGGSSYPPFPPH